MKYKINKNGAKRGIAFSIFTLIFVGMLFLNVLTPSFNVEAATVSEDVGLYFDVNGLLTDPVKVSSADKYYLSPTSYVYFGSIYNASSEKYEPILCRVLDADADNNGNGGAIFLLTENAVSLNQRFSTEDELWIDYMDVENIYTQSTMYKNARQEDIFTLAERSVIRPITKTDVAAEMEGVFGYSKDYGYTWETDTVVDYKAVKSDSAVMLNSSLVFPLSAKELNDYVANYASAPGMSATHITTKAPVSWWLRTGFDDEYGNLVGIVDEKGNVTYKGATSTDVAGRFAFNIETDNIAYIQAVSNNVYRLAYRTEKYTDFSANIFDVKNGTVKIEYSGAPTAAISDVRKDNYISVIIKDEDGNVKHYECIDEAIRFSSGTLSFDLPDNYSDGDSVYVFWEEKGENEFDVSFVGKFVELGCVHTPAKIANCKSSAICAKCGEHYGLTDWNNHENISSELYFDAEEDVHWRVCLDCEEKLDITECSFGSVCVLGCDCGNQDMSRAKHHFDDNGICIYDETHYEPPVQMGRGAVSDFEIHNEGQFLFLAEYVNSGSQKNIYGEFWGHPNIIKLMADLDFNNIDFIPMGTEEHPFNALHFYGNGYTVKNINYSTDSAYAGIFGVAEDVDMDNIRVENSNFSGNIGAGLLIGKAKNVNVKNILAFNSTAEATDSNGFEGSLIGVADEGTSIGGGSMSYGVYNNSNEILVFAGNSGASISNSFCLSEDSNPEKGEATLEQFKNGEVGYAYANYWRGSGKNAGQELGVDLYPYIGGPKIFSALTCDGRTVYFNDEAEREMIEAHSFNAFAKDPVEFIWQPSEGYKYSCHVHAICGICGREGLAEAYVSEKVYSSSSAQAVPRIDFTATITLGDVTATDSYIIISNNIQEYFGVNKVEKNFDGQSVSPFEFLENTRLDSDEYNAFFINSETDEKYFEISYDWYGQPYETPISVLGVGTYDLHLIGEGAFEGQEYIYKEILVIKPVTVTVTPKDVYKFHDGTAVFTSEFTTDASELLSEEWLIVKYGNSSSAKVGSYSVSVSAEIARDTYGYNEYKNAINIVLARNTVSAFILPANKVIIENKNYPTEFIYGDSIPVPTKDNFNVNFDTELSFEWYSVGEYDEYEEKAFDLKKIDGQPKNVGTYMLRVISAPTDDMLGATYDIIVEINKKQLDFSITVPEGAETKELYETLYYLIDSVDQLKWEIGGFAYSETAQSANITVEMTLESGDPFPESPDRNNYRVVYNVYCYDELGISGNYDCDGKVIYVSLPPSSIPTPQERKYIYEGGELEYEVLLSWKAPGVADAYGGYYEYTVEIYDENGVEIYNIVKGSLYSFADNTYLARLTKSGKYSVVIKCALRNWYNGPTIDQYVLDSYDFTVSITDDNRQNVDSINGMGRYTVSVDCKEKTSSAEVIAQRRITMFVKETSIDLNNANLSFNKENIVMKAGEVLLLGHTLSEVEFDIDSERGKITVSKIVVLDANGTDVSYLYALNTYDSSGEYNILHVYDSSCDTECNCDYCGKTRAAAHIGGHATCNTLATCSNCGMLYGDYDYSVHTSNSTTIVVNPEDNMTHLVLANCCGNVVNIFEHVQKTAATCTSLAHCLYCDWSYGELDPTNHSSSECEYLQISGNPNEHIKKHSCCGATEVEKHIGGVATCSTPAQCEKCKASYGELNKDNHESIPVCTLDPQDSNKHKIFYSCCEKSWIESHSGGKATCTDQAICELCKEKYGKTDPQTHATDKLDYLVREDNASMHDVFHSCCHLYIGKAYHSGGTSNCTTPALCEHCGAAYGKTNSAVHHSSEFVYIADGEKHIKAYACCSSEISKEEHKYTESTCTHGSLCEFCGYEEGERAEHVYDNDCDYICNVCNEVTRAAGFHTDENNDRLCDTCNAELESKGLSGGAISGIAVGSLTFVGISGFSLFWFVIKKKSWAALLKLLLG